MKNTQLRKNLNIELVEEHIERKQLSGGHIQYMEETVFKIMKILML